ncbi:hypothetical protein E4T39_01628 [Aureobasidium subglaciale]|nr:hypothetical protein E4T39_01628 [Aureobasidium subglaciale]
MDSETVVSGGELPPQGSQLTNLGEYFDRSGWWEEGAQALSSFFEEDVLIADTFDERLDDLLERLEPLKVVEEPQVSGKDRNSTGLSNVTANSVTLQHGQSPRPEERNDQGDKPRTNLEPQVHEAKKPMASGDQSEAAIDLESHREGSETFQSETRISTQITLTTVQSGGGKDPQTVAPGDISLTSPYPFLVTQLREDLSFVSSSVPQSPSLSTQQHDIANRAVLAEISAVREVTDTSSSVLDASTTSTRQTSHDPSTRATSVISEEASSFRPSSEKPPDVQTDARFLSETPDRGSLTNHAAGYRATSPTIVGDSHESEVDLTAPVSSFQGISSHDPDNNSKDSAIDSEADPTGIQAIKDEISDQHGLASVHDMPSRQLDDNFGETPTSLETDPTGLQTIKDELSDQYGLITNHDSSIISLEDDVTVLHDPSSAAASFFPPNPYPPLPIDHSFEGVDTQDQSTHEGSTSVAVEPLQDTLDSAEPTTLDSAPNYDQLMSRGSLTEDDMIKILADTPSPPLFSPLTPPLGISNASKFDQDAIGGAEPEEHESSRTITVPSTLEVPFIKLAEVTQKKKHGGKSGSAEMEAVSNTHNELSEELTQDSEDNVLAVAKTVSKCKRKQEEPHENEPPNKRRLSFVPEAEDSTAGSALTLGAKIAQGKSKLRRAKVTTRSTHRDSPDELASASPDELARHPISNPFALQKGPLLLAKPKVNRSTPRLSRGKKPSKGPATTTTIATPPNTTRRGRGNKELAGLLESSPPRKAADKAKAEVGGRLRSHQSNTPGPTSVSTYTPTPTTEPSALPMSTPPPESVSQTVDVVEEHTEATTTTEAPLPKRQRLTGTNPLGAQEISNLGTIIETRTRTRNATAEPANEPITKTTPKRVRKPAQTAAAVSSPFNLTTKSKGAPATSRRKAPAKRKAPE